MRAGERRARYASVLLLDDESTRIARPLLWLEWAESTGRRGSGPFAGPIPLGAASIPAVHELEAVAAIASTGYACVGGWHPTPRGIVTWIEPARCGSLEWATSVSKGGHAPASARRA